MSGSPLLARALAAALVTLALAACVGGAPPRQYFVLEAPGGAGGEPNRPPLTATLLVSAGTLDSFYDADSLVFSRAQGERQYYQFASWTERPPRRIAQLAQARLEARGGFAAVAGLTSGVAGDLALNLAVADFYHDARASPGAVRVSLVAELVDLRQRRLLGRRTFSAVAAVPTDDARGAVQAFDRASAEALDALAPWVEATAAEHWR